MDVDAVQRLALRGVWPPATEERDVVAIAGQPPKDLVQVNLGAASLRILAILPIDEKDPH